jgi:tRNA A37 threonylcarbamoyltransferase TsaD
MEKALPKMSRKVTVGIDLSYTRTGISLFECEDGEVVSYAVCSYTEPKDNKSKVPPERCKTIAAMIIGAVLSKLPSGVDCIDVAIIEVTPIVKSAKTSLNMYYLAGFMTAAFLAIDVGVELVSVNSVRKGIGCVNKKEAVLPRLKELTHSDQHEFLDKRNNDELDAMVLCFYHLMKKGTTNE